MLDVTVDGENVLVKGVIDKPFKSAMLFAAAPIDRRTSHYGSGLPFPSTALAFNTMSNSYTIETSSFEAYLKYPNAFYMVNGRDRVPPTIYLIIDDKIEFEYKLPDRFITRSLNYRYRVNNIPREYFFGYKDASLPVGNAEEVMRAYAKAKQQHNIA